MVQVGLSLMVGDKVVCTVPLKVRWQENARGELQRVHGRDARKEIADFVAREVQRSVDSELMLRLFEKLSEELLVSEE